MSRYIMPPLYEYTQQLFIPFTLGIALAGISVVCSVIMIYIEHRFNSQSSITSLLDDDFRQIKHFNYFIWLLIAIIVIGWSGIETFANQFTIPLMTEFDETEFYADVLLSVQSVYALTIGQIFAYVISKYGFLSYYLISSMFFMSLAMFIMYIYAGALSPGLVVWIVVICYVIGIQHFNAVSFSCLFIVCPLELTAIVNTVAAIGFMVGSTIQSYCFGAIADIASYSYAIFMCLCLASIGLITAFIVFGLDYKVNGPLHKPSMYNHYKSLPTESDHDQMQDRKP